MCLVPAFVSTNRERFAGIFCSGARADPAQQCQPVTRATVDIDGSTGRGGRLPAGIQSGEAAQPTRLRKPVNFCGAELSIPSSRRASPSLRWGWTKNKQKHKLNHVPGLTHGLDQKSEASQRHKRAPRSQPVNAMAN
jgi:hypothetical protein